MFSTESLVLSAIVVLAIPLLVLWRSVSGTTHGRLPPGPRPLPLLGNALGINFERPWLTYTEWGKKYGGIVYFTMLGKSCIILNSEKIAHALLDKRSLSYSGRPVIGTGKLFGLDFNTILLPYGDVLKQHRKLYHQTLRAEATVGYADMHLVKATTLARNLLERPGDLENSFKIYAASLIMTVTYGYEILPQRDPFLQQMQEVIDVTHRVLSPNISAILAGVPFVERLPDWFPGASYRRFAPKSRELAERTKEEPFQYTKAEVAKNSAPRSMVSDFLTQADEEQLREQEAIMKDVAMTAFLGGTDSTSATLHTFLLAMVLYPETQARAQAEIDAVVGKARLPTVEDRRSLPYVEAIWRETMRWVPAAPIGVPHASTSDDVYEGCFIPKGTMIMANVWAMTHDEVVWPQPEIFRPERHFTHEGKLRDMPSTSNIGFGFGRRICPGRFFADAATWMAMATILSLLRISTAEDSTGKEIKVKPDFATGLITRPKPFLCSITARSSEAMKLL